MDSESLLFVYIFDLEYCKDINVCMIIEELHQDGKMILKEKWRRKLLLTGQNVISYFTYNY